MDPASRRRSRGACSGAACSWRLPWPRSRSRCASPGSAGHGADGCSSQAQIAEQVAARLGRSPFAADAARTIDAYVTRGEGGWRAEILVRGRDGALAGTRELTSEAPDCAAIEAASVLAVALAIDPDAGLRPAPPRPPAPPQPLLPPSREVAAPPPSPLPVPISPSIPPASPLPAWVPPPVVAPPAVAALGASEAALRAGAGLGLLPRAAAALSLAGQVGLADSVHLTGEALWLPEVRTGDGRFGFGLSAFALGACVDVVRRARVDLAACGALWGGALHAVVYTLSPLAPGDHPWAAASLAPRLRIHLVSRLHAELGAQVLVPVVRQPFLVTSATAPVFQESPVGLFPFAGLGASFL